MRAMLSEYTLYTAQGDDWKFRDVFESEDAAQARARELTAETNIEESPLYCPRCGEPATEKYTSAAPPQNGHVLLEHDSYTVYEH